MAERFKAAVLKTVERKLRGFESLSLRHLCKPFGEERNERNVDIPEEIRRGGRAVEGGGLENR